MSTVPIDILSIIVSFLDWTCDLETFEVISDMLKLTPSEKDKILTYWKSNTKFITYTDINKNKSWCVNGKYHRTDGPAVECKNGGFQWWQNDQLHRLDGPAIISSYGLKQWYKHHKLHRIDGPAIEGDGIKKEWWINGKRKFDSI